MRFTHEKHPHEILMLGHGNGCSLVRMHVNWDIGLESLSDMKQAYFFFLLNQKGFLSGQKYQGGNIVFYIITLNTEPTKYLYLG